MRILCIDIGTGTQDIFLYNSDLDLENGFKLVVPSPTIIVHQRLKQATRQQLPVALTGVTMGGGPSQWAVEAHIKAGLSVFATPEAAQSFNDDLDVIREMGITLVSEDEIENLSSQILRLELRDFDFGAIARALAEFDVGLNNLTAVAIAVFDHGAAPPNYSDRQFRFDYIIDRLAVNRSLSAFAFKAADVPPIMTRLQAVINSAKDIDAPLVLMDTAPAAVLGATLDPIVQLQKKVLVANVGNFHTLAFRLNKGAIEGVFEHHTGLLNQQKLNNLLEKLAAGTLNHNEVFADHGHGAYIANTEPFFLSNNNCKLVVTGPRRQMMHGSPLQPYFATPFGDMMLTGCFGLLAATGSVLPKTTALIKKSLYRVKDSGITPWDVL